MPLLAMAASALVLPRVVKGRTRSRWGPAAGGNTGFAAEGRAQGLRGVTSRTFRFAAERLLIMGRQVPARQGSCPDPPRCATRLRRRHAHYRLPRHRPSPSAWPTPARPRLRRDPASTSTKRLYTTRASPSRTLTSIRVQAPEERLCPQLRAATALAWSVPTHLPSPDPASDSSLR
jgi:hypothetical protein